MTPSGKPPGLATFDVTRDLLESLRALADFNPGPHARADWLRNHNGYGWQPFRQEVEHQGSGSSTFLIKGYGRCSAEALLEPLRDLLDLRRRPDRVPVQLWSKPNGPRWALRIRVPSSKLELFQVRAWHLLDRIDRHVDVTCCGRQSPPPRNKKTLTLARQYVFQIRREIDRMSMLELMEAHARRYCQPFVQGYEVSIVPSPESAATLKLAGRTSYHPLQLLEPLAYLFGFTPYMERHARVPKWEISVPFSSDPRFSEALAIELKACRLLGEIDPRLDVLDFDTGPQSSVAR